MDILDALKAITASFDQEGIEYALCGGLAMAVYGLPRATLDIDLLIQSDSLLRVKRAVAPLGFTLSAAPMEFHGGKIRIDRLCRIDPETYDELILDFLLVTPETVSAWDSRREVEWDHGKLKVVSPQGLILLKSFRRSGKDQDDIAYLRSITDAG